MGWRSKRQLVKIRNGGLFTLTFNNFWLIIDFLTLKTTKAREKNIRQPGYLAPKQAEQAEQAETLAQHSTLQVARHGSCKGHYFVCFLFIACFFSSLFWQNFHEIDTNKDGYVSPEEIYEIKYDDLERLLGYMEEEEGEEENEEGENLDATEEEEDSQREEKSGHSTEEIPDADNTDREHTELWWSLVRLFKSSFNQETISCESVISLRVSRVGEHASARKSPRTRADEKKFIAPARCVSSRWLSHALLLVI